MERVISELRSVVLVKYDLIFIAWDLINVKIENLNSCTIALAYHGRNRPNKFHDGGPENLKLQYKVRCFNYII